MYQLTPSDEDLANLRDFIEHDVRKGFRSIPDVVRAATQYIFLSSPNSKPDTYEQWEDLAIPMTREAIARYEKEEETWDGATDNDRLNWVFEYLERTGIVARQNFWCCQTCGNDAVGTIMGEAPADKPYFGFVYFHEQDTDFAIHDGILTISYGDNPKLRKQKWVDYQARQQAYNKKTSLGQVPFYDVNVETFRDENLQFVPVDSSDSMARRVAARFMNAAILAGLDAGWNGSADRKIKLQLEWRQRRSTASQFVPEYFEDLASAELYRELGPEDDPEQYVV